VISLKKYATISVLKDVKEVLGKEKGDRDWSNFLLGLLTELKELRARVAFEELRRTLDAEDLERILKSSEEFRKGFTLR
jgi:predicted CopG family antitoxin